MVADTRLARSRSRVSFLRSKSRVDGHGDGHEEHRANPKLDAACIAAVRCLSADMPTAAKSGHPGAPLGCAPMAHALWGHLLRFSPKDPKWPNRDRFILSNGHACALQYAMLHLTGYELPLSELENFRRLHSKAPGHPENFMTPGVEVCTGPLGQGLSNAVGIAMARAHLAARFNRPNYTLFDSSTFVICGDGCMMEGVTSEACSIAGELALPGLVCAYDDNSITIDGSTEIAFTEDVGKRYEAYGWDVSTVAEGDTDLNGIVAALQRGRDLQRPCLIKVKTTIGFASIKANTAHVHGTPLSAEDLAQLRKASGFPEEAFHVPKRVGEYYRHRGMEGDEAMQDWKKLFERYAKDHHAEHAELARRLSGYLPTTWWVRLEACTRGEVQAGDPVLGALLRELPELAGGSVAEAPPLAPAPAQMAAECCFAQHFDFGSGREHAAAAVCVGMASYGAIAPFWRCPVALLPNAWGAVRLSALGQFRVIHVATHDGSDATEVIALCRATPNLALVRPADAAEVAGAYAAALGSRARPTVIMLPPPGSPRLSGTSIHSAVHGGYVYADFPDGLSQRAILMASGTEVSNIFAAQKILTNQGVGVRVVSLPSWELFEDQTDDYQLEVLMKGRLPVFYAEEGHAAPYGFEKFAAEAGARSIPTRDADAMAREVTKALAEVNGGR